MFAFPLLAVLSSIISRVSSQTPITLPVTYYLPGLEQANSQNPADAVYYYAKLCEAGVAGRTQAMLQLFESDNPEWNTANGPYVVAQVSVCENDFGSDCVIATNYRFVDGSRAEAHPNISWTIGNETEYYIRAMGEYTNSEFSMELTFTDGLTPFAFPYSVDVPFMSTKFPSSRNPDAMEQYWKTSVAASVKNSNEQAFSLAYCDQGKTISRINVAVIQAREGVEADYSLMQQWACPQTIELAKCTYIAAQISYWYNPAVSTFNLLPVIEEGQKTTKNGIWIKVSGHGANKDLMNTFVLNADTEST